MDALTSPPSIGMTPELWQLLADNLPQLAWVAHADGDIFWYNKRWYDYTGTTLEEMRGWGWRSVHHPERLDEVVERWTAALQAGEAFEQVFPLRRADGIYREFLTRAQPLRNAEGDITHWFGTNTDVTEQLIAETEVRRSAERLRRAVSIANIFVWETSGPQGATYWGENAAEILGVPEKDLPRAAEESMFFVAEEEHARLQETFDRATAEGRTEVTVEFRGIDGRSWHVECQLTYKSDGSLDRIFGATRDVTALMVERRRDEFFLRLEEGLRSSEDAAAAKRSAAALLGRELGASRVLYAEVQADQLTAAVRDEYRADGVASIAGTHRIPPDIVERYSRGAPLLSEDFRADPSFSTARDDPAIAELPFRAVLDIPLLREGRLVAVLAVHGVDPRRWTEDEVALALATAERTWDAVERTRAEERLRLSEAQFRSTAEALPGMLFMTDAAGRNLYVNDFYRAYTGKRDDEVLGDGWSPLVHPEDLPRVEAETARALGSGSVFEADYRIVRHDGQFRWHATRATPIRDSEGAIVRWLGISLDINDRREAEAALRESEARIRIATDHAEVGFWEVDEVNGVLIWPPLVKAMFGISADVPVSMADFFSGLHPDDREATAAEYLAAADPNRRALYDVEYRAVGKEDGVIRWVAAKGRGLFSDDGRCLRVLGTAIDITARKQAEEALRQSEHELRLRLDAIPQMVWSTLPDGYHDFYNDRWYEFTGTPPGSTDGEGWNAMFHPDDQDRAWERWRQSLASGEPYEIEYRLKHHSGAYRWVLGRALPIRDEAGEIVRWMGTCTDIDDRIAGRKALESSEARLRAIFSAVPVGLTFADADGAITGSNDQVVDLLAHNLVQSGGIDDYKNDYVAFHEDGRQVESHEYPMSRALAGEPLPELECQVRRGDGSLKWLRYIAAPIRTVDGTITGGVVASIDIDQEKKLNESLEREVERVVAEREAAQEALRQSQKLEAMGQLTGGVAHDFNNLLTPIIGSLDLLQRKQVLDERTGRLVDGALASAERARVLVQRLLAFARRQPLQPQAVDLRRIVSEMSELIDSTSGPRVRVQVSVPDHLPPALADGNQLEMALLNLAVNARDAMPDGGTLTIAVRSEDASAGKRLGLKAEPHLVLSVSDTGLGMDDETRRRAIEPFFSTKGVGKGTGLGLSMVHGLAAQLGGALDIRSASRIGTSIDLWLPVARTGVAADSEEVADVERHSSGIALLVDDEELVRASTAGMLADLGYVVEEAASGEEALAKVKGGLQPDILVTDQLMPGLSGTDLAVRLRETRADLPVLIVSGYADLDSLSPGFPHLSKPFRQAELASALEKLPAEQG